MWHSERQLKAIYRAMNPFNIMARFTRFVDKVLFVPPGEQVEETFEINNRELLVRGHYDSHGQIVRIMVRVMNPTSTFSFYGPPNAYELFTRFETFIEKLSK